MSTPPKTNESGAAVKPGETTVDKHEVTLSAEGMASLLKADFAADEAPPEKPAKPAATEIPAAAEAGKDGSEIVESAERQQAGNETDEERTEREAAEATAASELEARANEAGVTVEEQQAAEEAAALDEAANGNQTLPADAQAELEAWEDSGTPLPASLQKLVERRVGKLVTARDAEKVRADQAETALRTVTAERDALKADPNRPGAVAPQPVMGERQLAALERNGEAFVREAEMYLDESATPEERARVEAYMASERLDATGLKRRVRETSQFLNRDLPAQRQKLQEYRKQEQAITPFVTTFMSRIRDKATPEYAKGQEILQFVPNLRAVTPNHEAVMGTYVLGDKIVQRLVKAGVKGDLYAAIEAALDKQFPVAGKPTVPAPKAPPKTPAGGSAGAPRTGGVKPGDAARSKFNKTPNRQTAVDMARADLMS